jgi:uncharacterized protein
MATKDQPKPLMPHATATWLVDNTALSFEQIAEFCGLHILEVQAMADDLAGSKYTGRDPVHSGELTQGEIELGQADPSYSLKMHKAPVEVTRTKGPRYTPVSKRQDKPDGIAWILRHHPEVSDAQISKLIGTTRNTIGALRDRTHWNIQNIQAKDPVTLGLCSQRELDAMVAKAAKRAGITEDAEAPVRSERNDRENLIAEPTSRPQAPPRRKPKQKHGSPRAALPKRPRKRSTPKAGLSPTDCRWPERDNRAPANLYKTDKAAASFACAPPDCQPILLT